MRARPALRLPAVLTFAAVFSSVISANAQSLPKLRGEPPTRGPEIPIGVLAGDPDAGGVVLNAANLGFLRSWNALGMYSWQTDSAERGPGGGGLYFASPLPLIDWIAAGASVELLRPNSEFAYGNSAKLTFALAARVSPSFSLGASYGHVMMGALGNVDTLDLSAAARLGRFAALSLVVHDLSSPLVLGTPIQRVYQPELAIRPLGDYRFELALSARFGERRGDIDPMLRIQFVPVRGLTLRGAVEFVRDLDGDGIFDNELRGTVGLQFDFASFGFGAYALLGTRGDGSWGATGQGAAVTARLSGDRYPSLYRPLRFERVDINGAVTSTRGLPRLLDHLRKLSLDDRSDGILVVFGDLEGSWATMEELRGAFARLRAAGKHVVVFAAELSTKSYYAACAAERILIDPAGGVRLLGIQTQSFYLKGTFDKLGIKADFVKVAEYKSAPEQLMRDGSTDEAKMVRAAILDDLDARVIAAIASDRHIDAAKVIELRDAGPYTARGALQAGLVDGMKGGEEIELALSALVNGRRIEVVAPDSRPERPRAFERPAIAVIWIDGDIVEGKSRALPFDVPLLGRRVAGHESILAAINQARSDDRVRAILLRIDSPGGNALASDLIARELTRTRTEKPVICSFGDTAASGGYFIAAGCDTIVAEPSTITGSIGIFTGKFDLSGLAGLLGVAVEIGKRGARADLDSWFRPYTNEERALILDGLRYYYDRFVDQVASGRGMTHAQVDAVARGRVWTGAQAKERKLVDVLGGYLEALAIARQRGGLGERDDVELLSLPPEPTTLLGQLAQLVGWSARAEASLFALPSELRALIAAIPPSLVLGPSAPQARMDFALHE